jgi:hypothetical protein
MITSASENHNKKGDRKMKLKITINDDLAKHELFVKIAILESYLQWLKLSENEDVTTLDPDNWYQGNGCECGCDVINQVSNDNTPIYYSDIRDLWYLYSDDFEQAFEDSGCYSKKPQNYQQICIFMYLESVGHEFARTLESELNTLKDQDEMTFGFLYNSFVVLDERLSEELQSLNKEDSING